MKEKLSVRKVYRNAYRYVLSHLFAFAFLTIFYFTGSLLPMLLGASSFKLISLIYMYVFFYFATGCYFKQQLLWDKQLFISASIRFLTAIFIFLFSIFIASLAINFFIAFVKDIFGEVGFAITKAVLNGPWWLLSKYICIFLLFVTFFIVPSFTFVSEITGKSHSLLLAYSKTRGSLVSIAVTAFTALAALILIMFLLTFVNVYVAAVARAALLAFVSILYFKMYDFFYNFPQNKKDKILTEPSKKLKHDEQEKFVEQVIEKNTVAHVKKSEETVDESIVTSDNVQPNNLTADEVSDNDALTKKNKIHTETAQKKTMKKRKSL